MLGIQNIDSKTYEHTGYLSKKKVGQGSSLRSRADQKPKSDISPLNDLLPSTQPAKRIFRGYKKKKVAAAQPVNALPCR